MATEPAARTTPALRREAQTAMYERASRTLPGGTDSNFRAWGDDTIYVDRGKGGYVWDIDGNEYVDLRMGYGPVILGHGDDRVDDYVNERMRKGVSFSLTSEDEVDAMELVKELTGWVDKVRMTVSGTEATMHAMRIACIVASVPETVIRTLSIQPVISLTSSIAWTSSSEVSEKLTPLRIRSLT